MVQGPLFFCTSAHSGNYFETSKISLILFPEIASILKISNQSQLKISNLW